MPEHTFNNEDELKAFREDMASRTDEALSKGLQDKANRLAATMERLQLQEFLKWLEAQGYLNLGQTHEVIIAKYQEGHYGDERKDDQPVEGSEAQA